MTEMLLARQDFTMERNGIRSTILADTPRKADDLVVQQHPEFFYTPVKTTVTVQTTEIALDDGRQLGVRERTYEFEGPPPPDNPVEALRQVERHFEKALGPDLLSLWGQRTREDAFVIHAEVTRDVPAPPQIVVNVPQQPPVVNVTVDSEPVNATVTFDRDGAGRLAAATITEEAVA